MELHQGRAVRLAVAKVAAWGVLGLAMAGVQAGAQGIHVYGPGGPLAAVKECAAAYSAKTHHGVEVTGGPEKQWMGSAEKDADVVYGGAEYMLTQFEQKHAGFLAAGTRAELYARAAGILVRKGNPKRIRGLKDLAESGIKLLDVDGAGQVGLWEDVAGGEGLIGGLQRNIAVSVETSAEAVKLWDSRPELDAWITYESWHARLPETTEVVRLTGAERVLRGTPVAIAARSEKKVEAQAFIDFMKSPEGHAIFVKWGWE